MPATTETVGASSSRINFSFGALQQTGGNQAQAARLLNLKQTTLNEKIKRYSIYPEKLIYYNDDSAVSVDALDEPL